MSHLSEKTLYTLQIFTTCLFREFFRYITLTQINIANHYPYGTTVSYSIYLLLWQRKGINKDNMQEIMVKINLSIQNQTNIVYVKRRT